MKTMTYTESRARYAEVLDQVVNDREEIVITRQGHESAVIIAPRRVTSPLMETVYLMQSPRERPPPARIDRTAATRQPRRARSHRHP